MSFYSKFKLLPIITLFVGLILITNSYGLSAQHFQVITTGNPYNPMNILIDSATIDGTLLQSGSEIAVFNINNYGMEICVGQVTILNEFTSDTNYVIIATADDPTTPDIQDGFIPGNDIIFRYWDSDKNTEVTLISQQFNTTLEDNYQFFGTVLVELEGFSYITWTGVYDTVWNNLSNWNFARVPNYFIDVLIPSSPSGNRFPSVSIMDAKCRNLNLENNAEIKIHGKLTVGVQ